ncbi:MAG: peptidoglycan DD-metalloendopeptidase family protein [Clostridiales Family XIII bacterium]|jgi:murein DD-endopeptidase MepM/ murein hydrolase activator NlpD|nr:peptidoglycan DD-metalloendopeptidase family protein [Clostridiales Family XIII bacterium]
MPDNRNKTGKKYSLPDSIQPGACKKDDGQADKDVSFAVDEFVDRIFLFFSKCKGISKALFLTLAAALLQAGKAVSAFPRGVWIAAKPWFRKPKKALFPLYFFCKEKYAAILDAATKTSGRVKKTFLSWTEDAKARFNWAVDNDNLFALSLLEVYETVSGGFSKAAAIVAGRRRKVKRQTVRTKTRSPKFSFRAFNAFKTALSFRAFNAFKTAGGAIVKGTVLAKKRLVLVCLRVRAGAEKRKKILMIATACVFAAVICGVVIIDRITAYEYMYNEKVLGLVKDRKDVYGTIDLVADRIGKANNAEIHINKDTDISFRKVFISMGQPVDSQEDVLTRLTYMQDMKVRGYALLANGKSVAVLDSKETANAILADITELYTDGLNQGLYESVGFAENVEIKEIETKLARLNSREDALEYIRTGAIEEKIHTVMEGETISEIAHRNGMSAGELMAMNPGVIPERMQIGQELKMTRLAPLLTVATTETATYREPVYFGISYENTNTLYKGEQVVKQKGANGEREVTAKIYKENGLEAGKTELASTTIAEASSQVVLVGTKEVPKLIGKGYFQYPMRGEMTSRFGSRWGSMHNGIDLAAPVGTIIRAADGGNVVFSGYNGSLGYMIKIDHGGGRETLYGHCSKLLVSVGDRVYQGQYIADVGNTGRSTGPHLHFEVHVNGAPVNPLNYL